MIEFFTGFSNSQKILRCNVAESYKHYFGGEEQKRQKRFYYVLK